MKSLESYSLYKDSEEEFSFLLRMNFRWNDLEYQRMIELIRNVFREYKDDVLIPKTVIYFFTSEIDFIIGTVSKDVFFTIAPEGFTMEEYESLISKRKSELLELKKMFFAGDFFNLSLHSFFIE